MENTENGAPLCQMLITPTSHPPISESTHRGAVPSHLRLRPTGSVYMKLALSECGRSKSETPRISRVLNESITLELLVPLPSLAQLSIDLLKV